MRDPTRPFRALANLWRRDKLTALGVAALILFVLLGLLGPYLPIGDATRLAAGPRLSPPSWRFPFGTDELGRSYLPRVVVGVRSTFLISSAAVMLTASIGALLGMAAGYTRGLVDEVVARSADVLFSLPAMLVGLLIAAAMGPGRIAAISVIAIVTLPLFVRVVRSVTLTLTGRGFIVAAEVAGASAFRILSVHILPNIAGAVVIQLTYALSMGMIVESALSFLGLGVQPPDASLGSLLRQASPTLTFAPWLALFSGLTLSLAIMSVNLVGDAVRDALEPLDRRALT